MPIETVGSMKSILNDYSSKDWTKSAELDGAKSINFNELSIGDIESPSSKQSFGEMLSNSIAQVNGLQTEANKAMQKLSSGETKNLPEVMMSVEKADIAFRTMNQIRTKVIDAYKEVMRMQI
ncbi:flagellar hook-basal body complex protein FliE [Halobacteriovorax sp. JY17]|uniref:flagellar hook-basal body complex protein FliE n=1 Tax=Halobacteriovorax sp. JY17 TaxID=2014617 RepID=UPI000C3AAC06|nr:flagellar hook-basal body complex protein FliE [Halobacteriovorax sp. JY17]PIK13858.1 MAG: flagellar hook-basal body complex protein FliE [Halobacteriovorax sp. JY17]